MLSYYNNPSLFSVYDVIAVWFADANADSSDIVLNLGSRKRATSITKIYNTYDEVKNLGIYTYIYLYILI